jgi:hypothetical protein
VSGHSVEKDAGLEGRYRVEKIDDPTGKHDGCRYFVLDPRHDLIAREALRQYAADALTLGHIALFRDLNRWLASLASETGGAWVCGRCGQAPESHAPGGNADTCVYDPTFTRLPDTQSDGTGR